MAPAARSPTALLATTLLLLGAIGVGGCGREAARSEPRREAPLRELERVGVPRRVVPRLSLGVDYRACAVDSPGALGTVPRRDCGGADGDAVPAKILDVVLRRPLTSPRNGGVDIDALHETALVDLLWSDSAGISLRRSISYLRTVARLSDHPAPALGDLAAAYLVRAERTQSPRDLLEAVEAATRALDAEPRNAPARFDLALALDLLGLDEQAMRAWKGYLEVDSTSQWAREARSYASALFMESSRASPPSSVGASDSALAAFAATAPQEARVFGWNELLGGWGDATLANDSTRAHSLLHRARVVGEALARRRGDETLSDAVAAIDAGQRRHVAVRSLALAHRAYAAGQAAYQATDYDRAGPAFEQAVAVAPPSPALRQWSSLFLGATLVYRNERDRGERILREVVAHTDTVHHAALAGRARWMLGTTMLRTGRASGAAVARAADSLFARAGERENLGAVRFVAGEASFDVGDAERGYAETHRALLTLRGYRSSVWRHNALFVLARAAVADGLLRAALRAQDEGVAVAERTGLPFYVIEARLSRARVLAAAGDTAAAARDVAAAGVAVERLPAGGGARRWFDADLRLTEVAGLRGPATSALPQLDSVVDFYARVNNPVRLLPALLARTDVWLAARRVDSATADLRHATALLERRDADVQSADLRVALLDAARAVFDRLALLELEAGRPAEALDVMERGRASLASVAYSTSNGDRPIVAPPGTVMIEYTLVGDTLVAWTVVGRTVRAARSVVDRVRFAQTAERARASLELGGASAAGAAGLRADLVALYDWLVRPLESRLGGRDGKDATLVVTADGELAGVPFAALYDSAQHRYLVESHPLRFLPSFRAAAPDASAPPPDQALLIGSPSLDRRLFPDLGPLAGAAAEVRAVAGDYARVVVLGGADADRARVEAQLSRAGVVHFAGHAVFDDERPERSFLALAGSPGRLTAADVATLDLRRVRLVVLSACETMRAHGGRSGGLAGLTGAFLAAGAGGVVGSLWQVNDARTLELMREFHRAFRASGGDAARALRTAQLSQLHSPDPLRASPAAWSGFRYAGH